MAIKKISLFFYNKKLNGSKFHRFLNRIVSIVVTVSLYDASSDAQINK